MPEETLPYMRSIPEEKLRFIYEQFATVVYDTLVAPTTNSTIKYRTAVEKLWPRFIWPLLSGEKASSKNPNQDWDFAFLLSRNRALFQNSGGEALQERLITVSNEPISFIDLIAEKAQKQSEAASNSSDPVTKSSKSLLKNGPPKFEEPTKQPCY